LISRAAHLFDHHNLSQLPGNANLAVPHAIPGAITLHVSFHATQAKSRPLNQGISYNGHQPWLQQCGLYASSWIRRHSLLSFCFPVVPPTILPNTPFNSDPAGTISRYPPFGRITFLLLPPCCRLGRLTSSLGFTMNTIISKIHKLVEAELSTMTDQRVTSHIRRLLVKPEPIIRAWDYGHDSEGYPCWSVLNHPSSNTGIAFCEHGFGPKTPWGLIFLSGSENMSIGMDSSWFRYFLQAYFDSMASAELDIWRVFHQENNSYPGVPLTSEANWDSTWKEVYRLRVINPTNRYHCSQSLYKG